MSESICWNCRRPIHLGRDVRCPYCRAQLPRFYTVTLIRPEVTARTPARPHPDPLKRLEALLARIFRPWLQEEFRDYRVQQQPTAELGLSSSMVHHVFILDVRDKFIVNEAFSTLHIDEGEVWRFATRVRAARQVLIELIDPFKYAGRRLGRGVVVLCAGSAMSNGTLREKLDRVTFEFNRVTKYEIPYKDFAEKMGDYVSTTLKVAVVGYPGTGRDEIFTLLTGGVPPSAIQTILTLLNTKLPGTDARSTEGMRIGVLQISVLSFQFEDHWHFRKLWDLLFEPYFRGSRAVLLATDSTLENVLNSTDIVDLIRRWEIVAGVLAIANYQDRPGSLSPALVRRILGVKTIGLSTADLQAHDPAVAARILSEALSLGAPKEAQPSVKPELTF